MKLNKNQRIWLTSIVIALTGVILTLHVVFSDGGDEWPCCRRGSGVHMRQLMEWLK